MPGCSVAVPKGRVDTDIERLLQWTYADQRAWEVVNRGGGLHGLEAEADGIVLQGGSNMSFCAWVGSLGCIPDGLGAGGGRAAAAAGMLAPDAELVHAAVMDLDRVPAMLLILHGRRRTRPATDVGQPWMMRAVLNERGRPKMWSAKDLGLSRSNQLAACVVRCVDRTGIVGAARREWALWRDGLNAVADRLAGEGRLARWSPRRIDLPEVTDLWQGHPGDLADPRRVTGDDDTGRAAPRDMWGVDIGKTH